MRIISDLACRPGWEDVVRTRLAFTVVELLVSITIVGVLLSLSLAGVLYARESARKMSCSHHLRQISIASENYTSTHGVFASGGLVGLRYLSPLLEGQPGALLWNTQGYDSCNTGACPPEEGGWQRPPVYLCPSDPWTGQSARGASYRFCSGLSDVFVPVGISDGVGFADNNLRYQVRPAHVTDGLAFTALVSEQLLGYRDIAQEDNSIPTMDIAAREPLRYHWAINKVRDLTTEFALWESDCLRDPIDVRHHHGASVYSHRRSTYTHTQRPNRRSCFNATEQGAAGPVVPATSLHHGGVNVAFADGHGRFMADHIDLMVWRALGTRASQEQVSFTD